MFSFWKKSSNSTALKDEFWWSYIADYNGLPGIVGLNLALRLSVPRDDLPNLIKLDWHYTPDPEKDGLPFVAEHEAIGVLADQVLGYLTSTSTVMEVGHCIMNGYRRDYYYTPNGGQLIDQLREYCQGVAQNRKFTITVVDDPDWLSYCNFLFPNSATIAYYRAELAASGATPYIERCKHLLK